jgi:hypothetical protein
MHFICLLPFLFDIQIPYICHYLFGIHLQKKNTLLECINSAESLHVNSPPICLGYSSFANKICWIEEIFLISVCIIYFSMIFDCFVITF